MQELAAKGWTISAIARHLRLDRRTVRKFAHATSVEEVLTKATGRSDLLTPYLPYLTQRFNDGCTDAALLTKEIRVQGYRGSPQIVRRHLHPFRATTLAPPPPAGPTVRAVTTWITRHPDRLDANEQAKLAALRARSPHLDALAGHVTAFATMMTTLTGVCGGHVRDQVRRDRARQPDDRENPSDACGAWAAARRALPRFRLPVRGTPRRRPQEVRDRAGHAGSA
ncbi:hypothetical protein [Nonomuraea sp. NPDC002799]